MTKEQGWLALILIMLLSMCPNSYGYYFGYVSKVSDISLDARPYDVQIAGGYAYLPDHKGGMSVVDVSMPGEPKVMGRTLLSATEEMSLITTSGELG